MNPKTIHKKYYVQTSQQWKNCIINDYVHLIFLNVCHILSKFLQHKNKKVIFIIKTLTDGWNFLINERQYVN